MRTSPATNTYTIEQITIIFHTYVGEVSKYTKFILQIGTYKRSIGIK